MNNHQNSYSPAAASLTLTQIMGEMGQPPSRLQESEALATDLYTNVQAKSARIEQLQAALHDQTIRAKREVKKLKNEVTTLEFQLANTAAELGVMAQKANGSRMELQQAYRDLDSARETMHEMEQNNHSQEVHLLHLSEVVDERDQRIDELSKLLKDAENQVLKLAAELSEIQGMPQGNIWAAFYADDEPTPGQMIPPQGSN